METKLFVAAKAVITFNQKILIIRESANYSDGTKQGLFDVPGGRISPGEKVEESLLREVKEETGLDVKIGNAFFVNESSPIVKGEQWQIIRIFFGCVSNSDKVKLSKDHNEFKWINPKEYKNYNIIDNLFPMIEEYLKK
ncbi:MAG: NUDIX domain-containing protein [archaeon]|nr:NUDIX domain-containing protein [archaeon]